MVVIKNRCEVEFLSAEMLAEEIVAGEIKMLKNMHTDIPVPAVRLLTKQVESEIIKSNGSRIPAYTLGVYKRKEQVIELYLGSIWEAAKHDFDEMESQLIETLAHEYQHHFQFTSTFRNRYVTTHKEEVKQGVDYLEQTIEVDARAAAAWYLERRKPIRIHWGNGS